jgi:two-component system chemotaxis sensor kinase CheA
VEEVKEHLQEMEDSLLILEREGSSKEQLSRIFRAAHSIKGASSYMGFEQLAHLTHELESLISEIQAQSRPVSGKGVSLMLQWVDFVSRALAHLEGSQEELPLPATLQDDLRAALRAEAEPAVVNGERTLKAPSDKPGVPAKEAQTHRPASGGEEEDQEDARLQLDVFLESFRERFWDLMNLFAFSTEPVLPDSHLDRVEGLVKDLIDLSRRSGNSRIENVLLEWEKHQVEARRLGRKDRTNCFELFNRYAQRLQEALPALQLPLLVVGNGQAPDQGTTALDEEDQELLGIFVDSLQQNLSALASIAPSQPGTVLLETQITRARETVERMISSARYMDYEEVLQILDSLDESLTELGRNKQAGGHAFLKCLKTHGERLQELLPALDLPISCLGAEGTPAGTQAIEEDQELLGIFVDSLRQNLSALASLAPAQPGGSLSEHQTGQAHEIVKRMVSSARYMDYEEVVQILGRLDESLNELFQDGQCEGSSFLECLRAHGALLQQVLPGLEISALSIASEQPPAGAEVIEEDEELLGIFVDSMQQNLSELASVMAASPGIPLSENQLGQARSVIKRMISSARYMDYQEIELVLKDWDDAVGDFLSADGTPEAGVDHRLTEDYGERIRAMVISLRQPFQPSPPDSGEGIGVHAEGAEARQLPGDVGRPAPPGGARVLWQERGVTREPAPSSPGVERPVEPSGITGREASDQESLSARVRKRAKTGPASVPAEEKRIAATLRVSVQKVDQLLNQVMELVIRRSEFDETNTVLTDLLREFSMLGKLSREDLRKLRLLGLKLNESTLSLARVTSDLQDSVTRVRMLPVSSLFQRFPRVVRDQALRLGKQVDLIIEGGETEIDRRVLEQMYDPLVQLLRNAIAHGIETPPERRRAGKEETGTIRLTAFQEGDYVYLDVQDDGRGIDTVELKRILKKRKEASALDLDLLSERDLIQAVFLPGISTHVVVDGTAGRGVGLDVVKENVERMNGSIEVDSSSGLGAQFTIRIPLTVASIRALLVRAAEQVYAVPLNSVSEISRYRHEDTHTIEGFRVIEQHGKTVPVVRLNELLGMQDASMNGGHKFVVIVSTTFQDVGLVVDGLMGEREVVIKPIEESLYGYDGFSGATILGDGSISLILDVSALLRMMQAGRPATPGTLLDLHLQ